MNTTAILGIVIAVNILVLIATRVRRPAKSTNQSAEAASSAMSRSRVEKFGLLARLLRGRKGSNLIERNLVTAGLLLKPTEFLMANMVVFVGITALGLWYINSHMALDFSLGSMVKRTFALGLFLLVGWRGPQWILQFMANSRRTKLEYQLADALAVISSGLKGGYSFVQGLDMAAQQMEAPIKDEFGRVMRLVQLGLDTPRALEQMAERANSYDYDMTVSATNIQLAVGGNLSALLEGIANTIRDRIRLRREISALTAQGRISGGILIALPIGIAVMLKFVNPDYMAYLFNYPLGNNLIYMAIGQQAMGIFWIKKLLDFDN